MLLNKLYIIRIIVLFCGIYLAAILMGIDYSIDIPTEERCKGQDHFEIDKYLDEKKLKDLKELFPYATYLNSAQICNAQSIDEHIRLLDSINVKSPKMNREVIIQALTTELEANLQPSFEQTNLDSLIIIYQWVNRFNHFKDANDQNGYVYDIIYSHWMNFIANQLSTYYNQQSTIKYDFKFRLLESICISKKFYPPIGNTAIEKIIIYLSELRFTYLFNRFWNNTGIAFKGLFLTGLLMGLYCCYFTLKSILTKLQS